MTENSSEVTWKFINGIRCLYFTFYGDFKVDEAKILIEQWKVNLSEVADEKIIHVWQCLHMKSYETEARIAWQHALKKLSSRIAAIWLITDTVLIQAGAEIMGYFTNYNIKVVKSEEELYKRLT